VDALLKERVDVGRESTGLVAGVLDGRRRIDAAYGADNRALDADTVFEIGSISKVFTALLLADMIVRGEVAADEPIADAASKRQGSAGTAAAVIQRGLRATPA
jgi:CubicO group peptidase (beta-lactamase class C family)